MGSLRPILVPTPSPPLLNVKNPLMIQIPHPRFHLALPHINLCRFDNPTLANVREKPLTPYGELAALKVESDDCEDVCLRVEGLVDCVCGEDVWGVGVWVPEKPCECHDWPRISTDGVSPDEVETRGILQGGWRGDSYLWVEE